MQKNENKNELFFKQYQLYLNSIENISNRRDNANKYFISVNSGIVAALGFFITNVSNNIYPFLLVVLLFGMIISVLFYYLLNSYKQLNGAKFKLMHRIEKRLPIELYKEEWELLGKGKDYKKYYPFSHLEKVIPILFCGLYLLGFLYSCFIFIF